MGVWWLYILQCEDDTLYTGISDDVERRFSQHCNGVGAKYTRSHKPIAIVYREACSDKSEALSREYAVKKLTRQEKLNLIENYRET